jgi:hypothetical protein
VENALVIVKAMRMKVVDLRPENPEKWWLNFLWTDGDRMTQKIVHKI